MNMRTITIISFALIVPTFTSEGQEVSLSKDLQSLDWIIGKWEPQMKVSIRDYRTHREQLPHISYYAGFDYCILLKVDDVTAKASNNGTQIHLSCDFQLADERLPAPIFFSAEEVISWDDENGCFEIVCKAWAGRDTRAKKKDKPTLTKQLLKFDGEKSWLPLKSDEEKPPISSFQLEIHKLGDDQMRFSIFCPFFEEPGKVVVKANRVPTSTKKVNPQLQPSLN